MNKDGFHIRPAKEAKQDSEFILQAHDSAVRFLTDTVGSNQWGNEPFSKRERAVNLIKELVTKSEEELVGDQYLRTVIAEKSDINGGERIKCGAATVDAVFPAYVTNVKELREHIQSSLNSRDFLYLDRLISDRNTPNKLSKGVGKSLLDYCKTLTRKEGKRFLYSDCFAGPPFGLSEYYQSQGFRVIGPFEVPNKHVDGTDWPGVLLCCDLEECYNQHDI
jgi:hypothetical protein